MQIKTIKVGELRTNCYIYSDNNEAIIIDPGFEPEMILTNIEGLTVKAIILTHGHYDHVTDAFKVKSKTNAPIYIHKNDEAMMSFSNHEHADKLLEDGDLIKVGNSEFIVIHTPGHSSGGICLYNKAEKILFTGDTLFYHDHGRTDLPMSDQNQMTISLKKLLKLPEDTIVFPGHGKETKIGDEKNLFF